MSFIDTFTLARVSDKNMPLASKLVDARNRATGVLNSLELPSESDYEWEIRCIDKIERLEKRIELVKSEMENCDNPSATKRYLRLMQKRGLLEVTRSKLAKQNAGLATAHGKAKATQQELETKLMELME